MVLCARRDRFAPSIEIIYVDYFRLRQCSMVSTTTYCLHERYTRVCLSKFDNILCVDAWRVCEECYDFCLPDYSIQRLYKYQQVLTLGVRRLNCFRLMIPEWVHFLRESDATDIGRWNYPVMNGGQLTADRHRNEWRKQYRENDFYPKQYRENDLYPKLTTIAH